MKLGFATKIVLLILCLLAASKSVVAKSEWVSVSSKNFQLIGNAGEKDVRKVALRLEQYREALRLLFPKVNMERQVPTQVYVFSSHADFKPFKPRRDGKIEERIAGYIMERPEAMYIAVTEETRGGLTSYEAIFHEYYHYVLDNNFDNPPPWLHEGLAEFYSSFDMDADGKRFTLGAPINRHYYSFRQRPLMPLEKLLNTKYGSKDFNDRNKDNMLYAQSWAFVHFLMLGNEGKRQPQFIKFISQLNSGLPLEENFKQSFQTDYKSLDAELQSYIRKFSLPGMGYNLSNALEFETAMQARPMSEAETELQLGKLLWHLREGELAEKRLQKAVSLDQNLAPAHAWLGYLRMTQEKYDEAEKLLARARELDPKDYLTETYRGYLFGAQNKPDDAVKAFERAVELQPNLARTHANLAAFHAGRGDDKKAFLEYSRAIKLDPRNPDYFFSSSIIGLRLRSGLPAALQAQTWLRIRGWDKDSSPYAALMAYFGYRHANQKANADKILQIAAEKLDKSLWGYSILKYLQDQITSDELLVLAATDKDKLTEAHAYIGLILALENKLDKAKPHFEWVRDNGNKNFIEYGFALAELKRLDESKAAK